MTLLEAMNHRFSNEKTEISNHLLKLVYITVWMFQERPFTHVQLAEQVGCAERQIYRAIKWLTHNNYIKREGDYWKTIK